MRILHVLDPATPGCGPCVQHLAGLCARHVGDATHAAVTIGHGAAAAAAERRGVPVIGHLPAAPGARSRSAGRALRRLLQSRGGRGRGYDLVHGWGRGAATAMRHAMPGVPCVIWRETTDRDGDAGRPGAELTVILPSPDRLLPREVAPSAVIPAPTPAIDGGGGRVPSRPQGVGAPFAVGLIGEPATNADAWAAVSIVARVAVSGRRIVLVVHPASARRLKALRWLRSLGRPDLLRVDPCVAEPWRSAGRFDALLHLPSPGKPAAAAPLLWSMARGAAVLAERTAAASALIDDGRTGLLISGDEVNPSSRVLAKFVDEPATVESIGEAARRSSAAARDLDAFATAVRSAWERALAS